MAQMIYDIRTSDLAKRTLVNLTGVSLEIWEQYVEKEKEYRYVENLVSDVVNKHGMLPDSYKIFDFIYFHITTSANQCVSYTKYGILDLKKSYLCDESELKLFLEAHGIKIDLNKKILHYGEHEYDISYGEVPQDNTFEYYCWSIGRRFFYDYTTCGFLSVFENIPYGGNVHERPEILQDIDNLLGLDLSREWELTHQAYEVVVKIPGKNIVYFGDEKIPDEEKVIAFLTKAYQTAFGKPSEEDLLIQNGIQIPVSSIVEINPFNLWKE